MSFRIFLIRHSKSCSNLARDLGFFEESQDFRDPGLTVHGLVAAQKYGPELHEILVKNGFSLDSTIVGSSSLRRANETAGSLFPEKKIRLFPYLSEQGNLPENKPQSIQHVAGGWDKFVAWLRANKSLFPVNKATGMRNVVAVGHRTYYRKDVLEPMGKITDIGNMDGFILEIDDTSCKFVKYVRYKKTIPIKHDTCNTKMGASTRMKKTKNQTRKQRGGGYGLPQAYFQEGAQFAGTSPFETGTGLGASTAIMAREPLQVGGNQKGGFPPSVMGRFVANGMMFLPAVGYIVYKRMKNGQSKSKTRRHK